LRGLPTLGPDGWALGPLWGYLSSSYAARCAGEVARISPISVQYADYTLWQHAVLGDEGDADSVLGRSLSFWRAELAGLPEQLSLPFDRGRPGVLSYRGGSVGVRVSGRLDGGVLRRWRGGWAGPFVVRRGGVGALWWWWRLGWQRC